YLGYKSRDRLGGLSNEVDDGIKADVRRRDLIRPLRTAAMAAGIPLRVVQGESSPPGYTAYLLRGYTLLRALFAYGPCYDTACGEGHPSRSRSRTQKPWCAPSSSSTTCAHSSPASPLAYGGQPRPAGTGAGADSSSGVTVDSQRSSSASCTSRTASTSSRLGVAARSRPCSSWSGTNSDASPIAVNGLADPRQQRRNHESCTNTRWRRVSTADHSPPTRWCSQPLGIPWSRPSVAAQSARSCRKASCRSAGSADRISCRTGWRPPSSASTDDVTSTPLTTRLLTSPSITASCITTPIRRARVKLHSRNSASVRSWSSNLAMPVSIRLRADTPGQDAGLRVHAADPLAARPEALTGVSKHRTDTVGAGREAGPPFLLSPVARCSG